MAINPDDPRVRKTRQGLRDAFIRLILRKGYDDISIQDIASEAQAARITFYRHYRDKEELLTDCMNELYEDLRARTTRASPQELRNGYTPVNILYAHIEERETLYRVLFSSRGTQTVIERMRHHIAGRVMEGIEAYIAPEKLPAPIEIIAQHVASAQIGLAMWWLDADKPYPAAYMAQLSIYLTLNGLLRTLGAPPVTFPTPTLDSPPPTR